MFQLADDHLAGASTVPEHQEQVESNETLNVLIFQNRPRHNIIIGIFTTDPESIELCYVMNKDPRKPRHMRVPSPVIFRPLEAEVGYYPDTIDSK
jgi:hypothetical protein